MVDSAHHDHPPNAVVRPITYPDHVHPVVHPVHIEQPFRDTRRHHNPPTRFCLEAMDGLFEQGVPASVFDAGCGSAILAIAAHKLGCRDILAVDYDPLSVLSSGENLALNDIPAGGIDVRQMDLLAEWPARSFDHVYANHFDEMLIQLAPRLAEATGRFLVTTGIRETMGDAVCAALMAQGLNEIRRDGDGEWCGMVFSR